MRLTKHMKDVFVRAVMGEIPKPDGDALQKEVQDKLVAAMSEPVRALYATHPQALQTDFTYGLDERYMRTFVVGDANLDEILTPYYEKNEVRKQARNKLNAAVQGFTTTKQLADAFPEFAHHVPSEVKPTPGVPALNNVVADLVKLGWAPRVVR